MREKERNKVTLERRTVYLAAPPGIDPGVAHISKWTHPRTENTSVAIGKPKVEDVLSYLEVSGA